MKDYYDKYWREIDAPIADARSLERIKLAVEMLPERNKKVLDIGCGRGISALFLKNMGCEVKGIDISEEAVKHTKDKGIDAEVIDITIEELKGKYDIITCFEVLEHLTNPLGVLMKIKNNAETFIISLPNEFHIVRRLQILFGKQDVGGYNVPHIKFFDRRMAYQLIQDAGLKVSGIKYVPIFPPRTRIVNKIGRFMAKVSPDLFALSFIFKCNLAK